MLDPDDFLPAGVHEGYRKNLTELFCGGNGHAVTKLDAARMGRFPNLEVLWLNDNRITKLKGLQNNFRIKHLFLQGNCIATICNDASGGRAVRSVVARPKPRPQPMCIEGAQKGSGADLRGRWRSPVGYMTSQKT